MPKDANITMGGIRKGGDRPHNERLFLDLIRNNGSMSKAELTRATNLSAQSATVIVNRLVDEGLLMAGKAIKGKIGQPSIPYSLNPDGAFSIGIKVGRRSLEVASMSFDYKITQRLVRRYPFPRLDATRKEMKACVSEIFDKMTVDQRKKVVGIGITVPDDLSAWETTVGAPQGAMADWASSDLAAEMNEAFNLPTSTLNDASAACLAEIAQGNSHQSQNFLYFYVGTFIGGGISLGGQLYTGQNNLAGAIASLPTASVSSGVARQLLEGASLHYLEEAAQAEGFGQDCYYENGQLDSSTRAVFDNWLKIAAPQIAFAAVAGQAFLDTPVIIIDSSLSLELTKELVEAVKECVAHNYDNRGLATIKIEVGELGISARSIGSGILPFLSEFGLERE